MQPVASVTAVFASLMVAWSAAAAEPLVVEIWPGQVPDESGDIGPERVRRFYGLFGLAFFIYAGVWVSTYFSLPNKSGELLASVLGPSLLGTTLACGFEATNRIPRVALVLSLAHALGYFSGEMLYSNFDAPLGMLLWGVSYGVCYGSGIG